MQRHVTFSNLVPGPYIAIGESTCSYGAKERWCLTLDGIWSTYRDQIGFDPQNLACHEELFEAICESR